jgi:hypothetical protein
MKVRAAILRGKEISTSGIYRPAHIHSGHFVAFWKERIAHVAVQFVNERGFRHEEFPS